MKRLSDKAKAQRNHAKRRLAQRFGIELNNDEMEKLAQCIRLGLCEFVDKQSNRVTRWRARWGDQILILCYDKQRKQIITVLHEEWVDGGRG